MKKFTPKSMLGSEYMHEVTNVSRIFGRQHDISVIVEGDTAGVDEQGNIIYPTIDANALLSPQEILVSRGYVDHECGHKRHTDLPAFFDYGRQCRANNESLKLGIANGMEDPRMEAKVIQDYSGALANLTATADSVAQSWIDDHGQTAYDLHSLEQTSDKWYFFVGGALSILGRHECWGYDTDNFTKSIGVFQMLMGEQRMKQCSVFAKRLATLDNTRQVLSLADEVADWIRADVNGQQQPPQPDSQTQQPDG